MQNEIIYVYWNDGTIEKMTSERYHKNEIYLKPKHFWSNDPKSPNWKFENGKWNYVGKIQEDEITCPSCGTESRNCIC